MRIVVALGGNALLRRGEPMTAANQQANVRLACEALAPVAREHELVISHGNGPQVGLLALQGSAYTAVDVYPLDILDAQTQGQIGYMIQLELGNLLEPDRPAATLLTMVAVDRADPAFAAPSKPIGPQYTEADATSLATEKGWTFAPDGDSYRRVVPSPIPKQIVGLRQIRSLLEQHAVVLCAGGGGIPVAYTDETVPAGRRLVGVEAVIDKDLASALLAADLGADALVLATDVDAVYADWGRPDQRALTRVHPARINADTFAAGSMGPKVRAACQFADQPGRFAAIGTLSDIGLMLQQKAGTVFTTDADGVESDADRRDTGPAR